MKLPFKPDLSGKTAVITGGSGILGASFVGALAECGAKVAVLARNEEAAREALKDIRGEIAFFKADVTDLASLNHARDAVLAEYGKPSILINGAGGNNPKATTEDEIYKDGHRKLGMPITAFLVLLLVGFWVLIPLMIVGLFFDFKYRFAGPDLGKEIINDAMGKANNVAESIKNEFRSSQD